MKIKYMLSIYAISFFYLLNCNDQLTQSSRFNNSIIGTWAGSIGKPGGGGSALDSFGIVLRVTDSTFTIYRGSKIGNSALPTRDTSRNAGIWEKNITGDSVSFIPDTVNDSCFVTEGMGWVQCKSY